MALDTNKNKSSIIGMSLDELMSIITDFKEQKYRAKQIFNWVYNRNVNSITEMENIPNQLKINLTENSLLNPLKTLKVTGENRIHIRAYDCLVTNDTIDTHAHVREYLVFLLENNTNYKGSGKANFRFPSKNF